MCIHLIPYRITVPYYRTALPYRRAVEQVVDRAGEVLLARGIHSTSIVGGRTRQERSSAVSVFTTDPGIKVILLTTGSAAAGACAFVRSFGLRALPPASGCNYLRSCAPVISSFVFVLRCRVASTDSLFFVAAFRIMCYACTLHNEHDVF